MKKTGTSPDIERKLADIENVLTRGVETFIDPDGSFKQKLTAKVKGEYDKEIIIKFGVDPTRPDIHIGTAVGLRKMRKFQELGCKVIFLVGDFTAQIGDPTGKSKVRPDVDQKAVEANMRTYLEQIGKILILDDATFSWIRNSDWFLSPEDLIAPAGAKIKLTASMGGKKGVTEIPANSFVGKALYFENSRMQKTHLKKEQVFAITLRSFLWTLKHTTHAQLIERDMFKNRLDSAEELYMHEMMYPILQGIDSYMLARIYGSCDLEIGGTDQTFNMLMGRSVMKANKTEQQAVLSFGLIEGTDGREKMSKSMDNYIGITESPENMYGKVMSIKDHSILNYFRLAAVTPLEEIENISAQIQSGKNPRDIKMRLAREIVSLYHGEALAKKAEEAFVNTFQKQGVPDKLQQVFGAEGELLSDIFVREGVVVSKSDFRRLVSTGSIKRIPSEEKITDPFFVISKSEKLKVGKKRFVEIKTSKITPEDVRGE
jgi:tyrosyl-tRNA synthetase